MRSLALAATAALAIATPALAQSEAAKAQSEAVKAIAGSGNWEISSAERDRVCIVTFKADALRGGFRLEQDAACAVSMPVMKNVEVWTLANDVMRLRDNAGKTVFEFTEVEAGMYEAERPGEGIYFLQNAAAAPVLHTAEQMMGEWVVMRDTTKTICAMTLSSTAMSGEEGAYALRIKPGCDRSVASLNLSLWRMDQGELLLLSATGQSWRFEEEDTQSFTWRRVPEGAGAITMVKK